MQESLTLLNLWLKSLWLCVSPGALKAALAVTPTPWARRTEIGEYELSFPVLSHNIGLVTYPSEEYCKLGTTCSRNFFFFSFFKLSSPGADGEVK